MALPRKVAAAGTTALLLASPLMASPASAEDGSLAVHKDGATLSAWVVDVDGNTVTCLDEGDTAVLQAEVTSEDLYFGWSEWFVNDELWYRDPFNYDPGANPRNVIRAYPRLPISGGIHDPNLWPWLGPGDHTVRVEAVEYTLDPGAIMTIAGTLSIPLCSDGGEGVGGPPSGSPAYEKACNNNNAPEGRGPKFCQA